MRVVDVSDPRAPREVAYFVPPATENPVKPSQRSVLTNTAQVWGVVVDETTGLVYASDMNSGLWILRRTDTRPEPDRDSASSTDFPPGSASPARRPCCR